MNLYSKIYQESGFSKYWTQTIFWLVFYAINFYFSPAEISLTKALIWSAGNTLIFLIAVTINLNVLLPKFMLRQSIVSYLALLIGISLLLTPFITLFNIWISDSYNAHTHNPLVQAHFHFINLVIITALSSLVRIPLEWLKIQSEKNELVAKNMETELQSLKNQINPHFLFNTLNNLYALTLKKSDLAPQIVLKLSDMMRYMLYECNEHEVVLEKEFQYIENYIEIEKLRHVSDSRIEFNFDPALYTKKLAPLLLIPFIENSFKHGLQASLEKSYIEIEALLVDRTLEFKVNNSKPLTMPGHRIFNNSGGVGLANVKKRLQLIYPNQFNLDINDQPDSFSVHLKIKLKDS